jgi:hypothetical protein
MCPLLLAGMDEIPHAFRVEDTFCVNMLHFVLQVRAECLCGSCRPAFDSSEFHQSTTGKFLRSAG